MARDAVVALERGREQRRERLRRRRRLRAVEQRGDVRVVAHLSRASTALGVLQGGLL